MAMAPDCFVPISMALRRKGLKWGGLEFRAQSSRFGLCSLSLTVESVGFWVCRLGFRALGVQVSSSASGVWLGLHFLVRHGTS